MNLALLTRSLSSRRPRERSLGKLGHEVAGARSERVRPKREVDRLATRSERRRVYCRRERDEGQRVGFEISPEARKKDD